MAARLGLVVVAVVGSLVLIDGPRLGAVSTPQHWVPDDDVTAIVQVGDTVYVGGRFTRFTPSSGSAVAVDRRVGTRVGGWPEVAGGSVYAIASDRRGGWYLGGDFSHVQGLARGGLAHVRSDGSVDADWSPTVAGEVRAVAATANRVYVGGAFDRIDDAERSSLAALERESGRLTGWAPRLRPAPRGGNHVAEVNTVVARGGTVFAGGLFVTAAPRRHALAAFDASSGRTRAWTAQVRLDPCLGSGLCSQQPEVLDLAVVGSDLYVAGLFDRIGGSKRNLLGAVDLGTGVASRWHPDVGPNEGANVVAALAVDGDRVVVGGRFQRVAGQGRRSFAVVDRRTGRLRGGNVPFDGAVEDIAVRGSVAYVAGRFSRAGVRPRRNAAAVDLKRFRVLAWRPEPAGAASALAAAEARVYVGGVFAGLGGVSRQGLAALDADTGALRPWAPPVQSRFGRPIGDGVSALVAGDGVLYVGGAFTRIGGNRRRSLAAFDLATGALLPWTADVQDDDPRSEAEVKALALSRDTLVVGGTFAEVGGEEAVGLVAVNARTGVPRPLYLDAPRDPDFGGGGQVEALVAQGDEVHIGGDFESIGSLPARNFATLDLRTGLLSASFQFDSTVHALAVDGNRVYAGGLFREVGTAGRFGLEAIDARVGLAAFDPAFDPLERRLLAWSPTLGDLDDCFRCVSALTVRDGIVYAAGDFDRLAGLPRAGIAALEGTTGALLPWTPRLNEAFLGPSVRALGGSDSLWLGGRFSAVDGVPSAHLAVWPLARVR